MSEDMIVGRVIPAVNSGNYPLTGTVVHGKWQQKEDGNGDPYYDCSVCGESWVMIEGTPEQNGMKYCPHCGARMDGDGDGK